MPTTPSLLSRSGCWVSLPRSSIAQQHALNKRIWSIPGITTFCYRSGHARGFREKGDRQKRIARKRKNMNLNIWQMLVLALLQGVTELFPISSLGHTVIVPGLLPHLFPPDFATNTSCGGHSGFLPLIAAFHLRTSLALGAYSWRHAFPVLL